MDFESYKKKVKLFYVFDTALIVFIAVYFVLPVIGVATGVYLQDFVGSAVADMVETMQFPMLAVIALGYISLQKYTRCPGCKTYIKPKNILAMESFRCPNCSSTKFYNKK
ncbi:MAG: hypothetical protein IKK99_01660 [Oscillospiraceae bacterium]|nr:hypothetical protein [Oscillospiraceae bacterium]